MTSPADLVISARRIVLGATEMPGQIVVNGGRIAAVEPLQADVSARNRIRLQEDEVLLPGLVDVHVHVCDPGRTEWEGFDSATRAAAAGGVTTIVDMPLDCVPPTVSQTALAAKVRAAQGRCHVDVGFWGGVVPGNVAHLEELHRSGVLGFKCFLVDSGNEGFPPINTAEMVDVLRQLQTFNSPLLVHAEVTTELSELPPVTRSYRAYLSSRPASSEILAVAQVVDAARITGGRAHVVHLSSAGALPLIAAARREGVLVTCETAPHYLVIAAEGIGDGQTLVKCSPPIREAANRERLWNGLMEGTIDLVASDHSPCLPSMKHLGTGDFAAAWAGVASLELSLPVVWTEARRRGFALRDIARWMAERPAQLAGLARKGRIEVGRDADFCVLAPDEEFTADAALLHHRNPLVPYQGWRLAGVVRRTLLRGQPVDLDTPRGRLLFRQDEMRP